MKAFSSRVWKNSYARQIAHLQQSNIWRYIQICFVLLTGAVNNVLAINHIRNIIAINTPMALLDK